jgi:hypothetical protein
MNAKIATGLMRRTYTFPATASSVTLTCTKSKAKRSMRHIALPVKCASSINNGDYRLPWPRCVGICCHKLWRALHNSIKASENERAEKLGYRQKLNKLGL